MTAATLHASCVALGDRGLLILGASGVGKSGLALELIALGATLVADDRVTVSADGGALTAAAPSALAGLIEARGIGLLRMAHRPRATLALALDLDRSETSRLPPRRLLQLRGVALPLILAPSPLRAAAILAALRSWPPLDPDRD